MEKMYIDSKVVPNIVSPIDRKLIFKEIATGWSTEVKMCRIAITKFIFLNPFYIEKGQAILGKLAMG